MRQYVMIFTRADLYASARSKALHLIEACDIDSSGQLLNRAWFACVRDVRDVEKDKAKILKDSRGVCNKLPRDANGLVLFSDLLGLKTELFPEPPGETLMLRIGNSEKSMEVPQGFWQMERTGLKRFIAKMWPGVTWASNGGLGVFAINIRYAEAGSEP